MFLLCAIQDSQFRAAWSNLWLTDLVLGNRHGASIAGQPNSLWTILWILLWVVVCHNQAQLLKAKTGATYSTHLGHQGPRHDSKYFVASPKSARVRADPWQVFGRMPSCRTPEICASSQ